MGRKKRSRRQHQHDDSLTTTTHNSKSSMPLKTSFGPVEVRKFSHSSEILCDDDDDDRVGNQMSLVHNNNKKRKRQVRNVFVSDSIDNNLATFVCGDYKLAKEYSSENCHWLNENLNENYFDILSTNDDDNDKSLVIKVKSNWLTHIYSVKGEDFKDNKKSRCVVNTKIKEVS